MTNKDAGDNPMKVTKVFKNMFENFNFDYKPEQPKRVFVLEGSSGSSKTTSIIQLLIMYCQNNNGKNKKITALRAKYSWVKDTILKEFIDALITYNLYEEKNHMRSHPQSYTLFGNTINFGGLDDPQRFHGLRQDITWINEAMEADQASYDQLNIRTNEAIILDFNPSYTTHWIFDNILKNHEGTENIFYWHSTYKDNPYLPRGQRESIEAWEPWHPEDRHLPYDKRRPHPVNIENGTADEHKWMVYGEGKRAVLEGLIFKNVVYVEEFPKDVVYWYGLDFGWTHDPTAVVKCAIQGNSIYLQKMIYEPIDNPNTLSLALKAHGISKRSIIGADSADRYNEFEFIKDLRNLGWGNITAIRKTKGVIYWINQLKSFKIHIVGQNDTDFRREQENYKWRLIGGKPVDEPVDAYNHLWDASRYALMIYKNQVSPFW